MIHNHACQKLFPDVIAHPYSLFLSIPIYYMQETHLLLCNWHIIKLQPSSLWTLNQYVIKLPMFSALIQHNVKLQDRPNYG
jgi:hypothetical protein